MGKDTRGHEERRSEFRAVFTRAGVRQMVDRAVNAKLMDKEAALAAPRAQRLGAQAVRVQQHLERYSFLECSRITCSSHDSYLQISGDNVVDAGADVRALDPVETDVAAAAA